MKPDAASRKNGRFAKVSFCGEEGEDMHIAVLHNTSIDICCDTLLFPYQQSFRLPTITGQGMKNFVLQ